MPDILTLLLGTFALYILLYGACWSIDKTDIEKHNSKTCKYFGDDGMD